MIVVEQTAPAAPKRRFHRAVSREDPAERTLALMAESIQGMRCSMSIRVSSIVAAATLFLVAHSTYADIIDDNGTILSKDNFVVESSSSPANGQEIFVNGSSELTLSDLGELNAVVVSESGRFVMDGGAIFDDDDTAIVARDSAELTIRSGTVFSNDAYLIHSFGEAKVTVDGGTFATDPTGYFAFRTTGTSTVSIGGGDFSGLHMPDLFEVRDESTVHIFGEDLRITDNQMTGTLLDGNMLAGTVQVVDQGRIVLHNVPEPSGVVMMIAAFLCLTRIRSRNVLVAQGRKRENAGAN